MSMNGDGRIEMPDPEVVPKAERRQFSTEEKLRILAEADACTQPSEVGALLRREGIYSSYLTKWRMARDRGLLLAASDQKRGPKPSSEVALRRELATLKRENEQLRTRLNQAEAIIEVQKKVSQLLGPSLQMSENGDR